MGNRLLEPIWNYIPENNRLERIWKIAQVDFRKRYYNDRLGLLWALLNPIFQVVIYYAVFTLIFHRAIEGIEHYHLFIFSGIIFWATFRETSIKGMRILQSKKYLIENIQLNKFDLYLSNGISSLLGFLFNLFALLIISLFFGVRYSFHLIYLPVLIINVYFIAIGFGMILSVVFIYFNDINHLLDIVFLVGFWSSGIFFRGDVFKEIFPALMYLNPFIGIIVNVRNVALYDQMVDLQMLFLNLGAGILILLFGYWVVMKYSSLALERM